MGDPAIKSRIEKDQQHRQLSPLEKTQYASFASYVYPGISKLCFLCRHITRLQELSWRGVYKAIKITRKGG